MCRISDTQIERASESTSPHDPPDPEIVEAEVRDDAVEESDDVEGEDPELDPELDLELDPELDVADVADVADVPPETPEKEKVSDASDASDRLLPMPKSYSITYCGND